MQVSLKWVNELVDLKNIKVNNLIEKLTLGGFEVEEIIEIETGNQKDIALDISTTANRSDSLSIQGFSKEILSLLNVPIKSSTYLIKDFDWKQKIKDQSILTSNEDYCSTFLAFTIENLTNTSSPNWLKQKLINSGYKPINNLSDFQTYILLETGYPFEFYDLNKLSSKLKTSKFDLNIKNKNERSEFLAANNLNYKLDNSISVLTANNLPISIAGIIPNKAFSYTNNTQALLIEGSIFNSTEIRQKSRRLGLRTDRSAKYEKSLKETYLLESFYKLLYLLKISNPKLTIKFHSFKQAERNNIDPIYLNYQTIKEVLGPTINSSKNEFNFVTPKQITNYLNRLDIDHNYDVSNKIWKVKVPYTRSEDLTCEIDLVEEIGRLHGFNQFLTRLPKIRRIGKKDYTYQTRNKITSCLLSLGFNELIHYSLVNQRTFLINNIKLVNPLIEDYSYLRTTLLPSLIQTIKENLKYKNKSIEGFEFGHVFLGDNLKTLEEREYVAGIFGGINTKLTWSDPSIPMNWFEAKGKIEQFFSQLNIKPIWKNYSVSDKNLILHPYRTAKLSFKNNIYLGTFGQINPILAKSLNIPSNLYLFEFDLEAIQKQIQINNLTIYQEYSSYPKIRKDLSFIVNQDVNFKEIKSLIYTNGTKFLSEINLLDEYQGSSIPEKYTSLCLQLTFQSTEKTLENKKIEEIINNLQSLLINKFNVQIRN